MGLRNLNPGGLTDAVGGFGWPLTMMLLILLGFFAIVALGFYAFGYGEAKDES